MSIQPFKVLCLFLFLSGTNFYLFAQAKIDLNKPFSSLTEARDAVRAYKKNNQLPKNDIVVYIKGGVHPVDETISFTAEDAGTETCNIIFKPYQNKIVQFIGGKKISGFTPLQNKDALARINPKFHDKIYQIDLKAMGISNFGTIKTSGFKRPIRPTGLELFYNGKPMTLAQYPNQGWSRIDSVPQTGDLQERGLERVKRYGIPIGRHYGRFTYQGLRPNHWTNNPDIWLHGYWTHDWADSYVKVDKIDTVLHEFILGKPHAEYGYTKNQKYYAFNILEELDSPGEWYLDKNSGMLYFWPPSPIEEGEAFVSMLEHDMIHLDNVSHVRFENFLFEITRGAGIVIKNGYHNTIAGCTLRNIGTRGIIIQGGTQHKVESCDIYNIGDEAILMSGGDRKKLISGEHIAINNDIYNYSRIDRTYRPAIKLTGVGLTIAHNHIHDAPHTGVIFEGNNHVLEYNEVNDIARETGDVGAFYTGRDWTQRGNVVRYNYFHHLHGPGAHGVNAVYMDDSGSGVKVTGNIFYDVDRGVLIGGGHDNIIENNVFIDCKLSIYLDARGLTWAKNYIVKEGGWKLYEKLDLMQYNQPPYSTQYPELSKILENKNLAIPHGNLAKNNICYGNWIGYFDGAKPEFITIQNNKIMPSITNSKINDGKTDLKSLKKFEKKGYQKIPFNEIGLYKDQYRKTL